MYTFSPIESFMEVNHIDGNKDNNRFDNLEWSTRKDNAQHAFDNDLNVTGEDHPNTFLSNTQVSHIKFLLERGYCNRSIADYYKVRTSLVADIKRGRTWKKVKALKEGTLIKKHVAGKKVIDLSTDIVYDNITIAAKAINRSYSFVKTDLRLNTRKTTLRYYKENE